MKEYRVETRVYYSKMTRNVNHIAETTQAASQEIIDRYAAQGWELASTDATVFGSGMYVYLYFEREDLGHID